ncbi:MAG TPA: hypothetical protein VIQ81_07605 [Gammaproteobacteria bacterium]
MKKTKRKKKLDIGQLIGAIIFIFLFITLILLGVFYEASVEFTSSFFEDVSEAIKWKR